MSLFDRQGWMRSTVKEYSIDQQCRHLRTERIANSNRVKCLDCHKVKRGKDAADTAPSFGECSAGG